MSKKGERLLPCEGSHQVLHGKGAVHNENNMDRAVWDRPYVLADGLLVITYLYLGHIASAVCTKEWLDQVCAVRTADRHLASIVQISSVFHGKTVWQDTSGTLCNTFYRCTV